MGTKRRTSDDAIVLLGVSTMRHVVEDTVKAWTALGIPPELQAAGLESVVKTIDRFVGDQRCRACSDERIHNGHGRGV